MTEAADADDTERYVVNLQFLVDPKADRSVMEAAVRQRIEVLDGVGDIQLITAETRAVDPATVVYALGVAVVVTRQAAQVVQAITGLVKAARELAAEVQGIREAKLEVADDVLNVSQLGIEDIKRAASAATE